MTRTKNLGILIFDDVEVLDFCGPFEVFSLTGKDTKEPPFNVYTLAEKNTPVKARNGLSVNPCYSIYNCPKSDILLVPGGMGTRREMYNYPLIKWIKEMSVQVELLLSVCTGSLLLAAGGLLEGLSATTHHGAMDLLREVAPHATLRPEERFVDNGKIITAAGISAGIDMSLYVVARLIGKNEAVKTSRDMEYDWHPRFSS